MRTPGPKPWLGRAMALFLLVFGVGAKPDTTELPVVSQVDLSRYMGRWYSIASIPQTFDRKCAGGTQARYSLNPDGTVAVLNSCYLGDGSLSQAKGVAWVADSRTNAKLKVSFIPWLKLNFLAGDYWIIDLDPDYTYAVVGHPSRQYGWILSRTPQLNPDLLSRIRQRLESQGYEVARFRMVNHQDYPPAGRAE